MNFNLAEIRRQLAPGWSPTNIALLVILFLISRFLLFPLMLVYVLLGDRIGLNLGEPSSWGPAMGRLQQRIASLFNPAGAQNGRDTGSPDTSWQRSGKRGDDDSSEKSEFEAARETLNAERRQFERERSEFEKEKKAFEERRRESDDAHR